ncbi:MAG TPA: hypothetical protein GX510_00795 [Firmicutes bacterium]|nr:hypothetical protein [Candidatus Fermentithermobacillaceae bacterium]
MIQEIPLGHLEQVTISSRGVTVSIGALTGCVELGIPVNFLTSSGKPYALASSGISPSTGRELNPISK